MSPSFRVFPEEILLEIAEQVSPGDLEGFALTDRRLHRIASSRLEEHRTFLKSLSSLDMFFSKKNNPLETILGLCTNARALHYPTRIDLVGAHAQDCRLGLPRGNSKDLWKEVIQEIAQITPLMRNAGEEVSGRAGGRPNYACYGILLATCICLFPNLRAIRLPALLGYNKNCRPVEELFRKLAENGPKRDGHQLLQNLSKITIAFHRPYGEFSRVFLELIATFPNLTNLELIGVSSIDTDITSKELRGKLSHIKELSFKDALDKQEEFAVLFWCFKNLRRFQYSHPRMSYSGEPVVCTLCECDCILIKLSHKSGDTLEALSIDLPCDENHEPVETIQDFRNLRTVTITAQSLEQEPGESLNLAAILPASIEEIILTDSMPFCPPGTWDTTSRRGPLCNLRSFHNLRKLTLASRLLLQADGELLDPSDFLPDAIEEFTILSPARLRYYTYWKEIEQFLMYLPTLQRCDKDSLEKITVGFGNRMPSLTIEPQQSFDTDFSEGKPFNSMWEAVMETYKGLERRYSREVNIVLVLKFGRNNPKALTISDVPTK